MKFVLACVLVFALFSAANAHNWVKTPVTRNGNKAATAVPCPQATQAYEALQLAKGSDLEMSWSINHSGDHWVKIVNLDQESTIETLDTSALLGYQTFENKVESGTITTSTLDNGEYLVQYGWSNYRNCISLTIGSTSTPDSTSTATCDAYCTDMLSTCADEYADNADCQAKCAEFSTDGTDGDTVGNSLQCRITHVVEAKAGEDVAAHCGNAANDGGEACTDGAAGGSSCDDYCTDALTYCEGANAIYVNRDACMESCATFPTDGTPGSHSGNSLQCRVYHLHVEGGDPAVHCPHASVEGGGKCVGGSNYTAGVSIQVIMKDPDWDVSTAVKDALVASGYSEDSFSVSDATNVGEGGSTYTVVVTFDEEETAQEIKDETAWKSSFTSDNGFTEVYVAQAPADIAAATGTNPVVVLVAALVAVALLL